MNAALSEFSEKYVEKGLLKRPVVIDSTDCMSSLSNTTSAVRMSGQKVSLIVDEVDSFANRLLVQVSRKMGLDNSGYNEFVKQEGSVLRQFGRVVKSESNTCIEKMFFTGVMPVAWSDAFSSLNTVKDLTHTKAFEDTLGFKTSDISKLMGQLFPKMTVEESRKHLESIKAKCNGYRRSSTQVEGLYNPQGVWYYMEQLRDKGDQMVPRMDPNIVQPARDEVAAFLVKHAAGESTQTELFNNDILIDFLQQLRKLTRRCISSMESSLSLRCRGSPRSFFSTMSAHQTRCSAWLTTAVTCPMHIKKMKCMEIVWLPLMTE